MHKVQEQLPFNIETPSDGDLFERFFKEKAEHRFQAQSTIGGRTQIVNAPKNKALRRKHKAQRKARAKQRA